MSRYIEHYEIMSHDVDANNNAKPSVIARLLQETANHQMRDRKPTYYELFSQGKSYILIRMKCQISDSLHPYDLVDVATWTGPSKGATFRRSYLMTRGDEEIVRAYSEWAVVDLNSGKILRVDEIDSSNYETDEDIEIDIPAKFHIPNDLDLKFLGDRKVAFTDCDMNLHMNNTLYHDMIWNVLPENGSRLLTGFTMRFHKEAALGKNIEIYGAKADSDSHYIRTLVRDDDNTPHTNLEAIIKTSSL